MHSLSTDTQSSPTTSSLSDTSSSLSESTSSFTPTTSSESFTPSTSSFTQSSSSLSETESSSTITHTSSLSESSSSFTESTRSESFTPSTSTLSGTSSSESQTSSSTTSESATNTQTAFQMRLPVGASTTTIHTYTITSSTSFSHTTTRTPTFQPHTTYTTALGCIAQGGGGCVSDSDCCYVPGGAICSATGSGGSKECTGPKCTVADVTFASCGLCMKSCGQAADRMAVCNSFGMNFGDTNCTTISANGGGGRW